jgi:hypothetical protein
MSTEPVSNEINKITKKKKKNVYHLGPGMYLSGRALD